MIYKRWRCRKSNTCKLKGRSVQYVVIDICDLFCIYTFSFHSSISLRLTLAHLSIHCFLELREKDLYAFFSASKLQETEAQRNCCFAFPWFRRVMASYRMHRTIASFRCKKLSSHFGLAVSSISSKNAQYRKPVVSWLHGKAHITLYFL